MAAGEVTRILCGFLHCDDALFSPMLTNLPRDSSKPTAVICHTVKGKGIPFAENNMAWHHQNKVTAQDAERLLAALEAR